MSEIYPPQQRQTGSPALSLEVWGATDRGHKREGNEDAVYPHSGSDASFEPGPRRLAQKGQLLIVADGVGGAQAGSQASRWAVRVAVEGYYDISGPDPESNLRAAIEKANASLYQYLESTGTREAGSTMAAAVILKNSLYVANVGDSRVYLLRGGRITQLTRDHTLAQQKLDRGLIRPEQMELDPDRSVLTRSLGALATVQVDVFPTLQLAPGDAVLLCSDGLTDMLSEDEIARTASRNLPKRAAKRLIAAANKRGGLDNISVVIARANGELLKGVEGTSRRRKPLLLGGAVLVMAVLCVLAVLGWEMVKGRDRQRPTPTSAPTATAQVAPTATATAAATPSVVQPTDTAKPDLPTSTPAPTLTPTNTPRPPTATVMPTSTPTPMPTQRKKKPTPER